MLIIKVGQRNAANARSGVEQPRGRKLAMTTSDRPRSWSAPEIWASGGAGGSNMADVASEVSSLLTDAERVDLRALCGRTLWHSLTTAVRPRSDDSSTVFVATGEIDDMWIRDSAVQLSIYFPRLGTRPALRRIVEGAMRAQAFYIVQDPYANAYSSRWRDVDKLSKYENE